MELINLAPRLDVDPSIPLRSPGEVLLHDYMRPESMNPQQFARRSGIPSRHLKGFLSGVRAITPKHAVRLAAVLRTSALYWLVLQARYDLAREASSNPMAGGTATNTCASPDIR